MTGGVHVETWRVSWTLGCFLEEEGREDGEGAWGSPESWLVLLFSLLRGKPTSRAICSISAFTCFSESPFRRA